MSKLSPSKAIIITFWGALIGLIVTYALVGWKEFFLPFFGGYFPEDDKTDRIILVFILLMIIRHQFRMAFYDSSYFTAINRVYERIVMALLLPIAVLAGSLMLLFSYGLKVGAAAMALYSVLFSAVGFCAANGHSGKQAKQRANMAISWIIDFVNALLWFAVVLINVRDGYRPWFFVGIVTVAVFCEFWWVFKKGVSERLSVAWQILSE